MYAEERQQAIAQLVGRARPGLGRASSPTSSTSPPRPCAATSPSLERLGLLRRVHGGAVPARPLAVIESGLGERDQANTAREGPDRRGRPRPAPAAGGTVLLDAGSTTEPARQPAPPRPPAHRRHPRGARSRPGSPARPHVELHLLPGRVRAHHPGGRRRRHRGGPRPAPRRRRVPRHQRPHRRATACSTPDRDEAATKRAMVAAAPAGRRARRLQQDRRRAPGPVRRARRGRRAGHRRRHHRRRPHAPSSRAGVEVVVA